MIQDFWETESTRVYLFWVNTLWMTLAQKEKNLSSEIECRSLSGLPQQGASYYISWIPGPWVSLAWKRSSICSYEENRKTHFSVAWYWTGGFSHEDILARGKCSLRKVPAGSSNLSPAIHEILSDSSPPLLKWLGTESELPQKPVFSYGILVFQVYSTLHTGQLHEKLYLVQTFSCDDKSI